MYTKRNVNENHIKYGIIIDAGSSGSRIQIYSWTDPKYLIELIKKDDTEYLPYITKDGLPCIEQGSSQDNLDFQLKIEEGISTYSEHPQDIGPNHVKLLMDYAMTVIPEDELKKTNVYLYATAGMRLLTKDKQDAILNEIYSYIKNNYPFVIDNFNEDIRVITGEEEGLFGWISVNYLEHGFSVNEETLERTTYNFVDMGGASTQIAYELDKNLRLTDKTTNIVPLKLNTLLDENLNFNIYVITFLGYGVNEARRRYLEDFISKKRESSQEYQKLLKSKEEEVNVNSVGRRDTVSASDPTQSTNENKTVVDEKDKIIWEDPCLPVDATQENIKPVDFIELYGEKEGQFMTDYVSIKGTGKFDECVENVYPLLNETISCSSDSCLFNGVFSPATQFDDDQFLGIGKYWDVANIYGLGGTYNYPSFLNSSQGFCKENWSVHEANYNKGMYPDVPKPSDLALNCFRSAWLETIIHDGYNIPKEDPQDIPLTSLSYINGTEASWALGALIKQISDDINSIELMGNEVSSSAKGRPSPSLAQSIIIPSTAILLTGAMGLFLFRWKKVHGHQPLDDGECGNGSSSHKNNHHDNAESLFVEDDSLRLIEEGQKDDSFDL